MILNTKCLRCGSTNNLHTRMSVIVDNNNYDITLCDEHAEDTTPKQAKDIVKNKLQEYQSLLQKLNEFGLSINVDDKSGIATAQKVQTTPEQSEEPEVCKPAPQEDKKQIIKRRKLPAVRWSASGQIAGSDNQSLSLEKRTGLDVSNTVQTIIEAAKQNGRIAKEEKVTIPQVEEVEMQTVPGRLWQPMQIQKKVKYSDGGQTQINIVDAGGDAMIQSRFKALAADQSSYSFGKSGYDTKECTACDGTGIAKIGGNKCPKCRGIGLLNKGWSK